MLGRASWAYGLGRHFHRPAGGRSRPGRDARLYVIAGYVLAFWLDGPGRFARVKATFLSITASV